MQREVNRVSNSLLHSFKATTQINDSLSKYKEEKVSSQTLGKSSNLSKGKLYAKEARLELHQNNLKGKHPFTLESEVVSLETHVVASSNPRTREMIRRLDESRRNRHIKALEEYEETISKLEINVKGFFDSVSSETNSTMEKSNNLLDSFFDSLTDGELLSQEIIFVNQLSKEIQSQKEDRQTRLKLLHEKAKKIVSEFKTSYEDFINALRKSLFDIAFVLEDDVNSIENQKNQQLDASFLKVSEMFSTFFQEAFASEKEKFSEYERLKEEKEKRWRKLKHEEAILKFRTILQESRFQNPPPRIQAFSALKEKHDFSISQRKNFMKRFLEIDNPRFTVKAVDSLISEMKTSNEEIQEAYDALFNHLFSLSKQLEENLEFEIRELAAALEMYAFLTKEEISECLENECRKLLDDIKEADKKLLKEAIAFVEDSDFKAQEVANNLSIFSRKIAEIYDSQRVQFVTISNNYELSKAKAADDSEEKLEILNSKFEKSKETLSLSVHHLMLEENLKEVFAVLDQLEEEYRAFHEGNSEIVRKHPMLLQEYFFSWENAVASAFSMVSKDKEDELKARNEAKAVAEANKLFEEQKQLKAAEEEKAAEEAKAKKAKPPAKKDPKKAAAEEEEIYKSILASVPRDPILPFTSPLNYQWLLEKPLALVCSAFFPNEEKESKEVVTPNDPNGQKILSENVEVELSFLETLLQNFRTKIFQFIADRAEFLGDACEKSDSIYIDTSLEILEQRLKKHYPLKGKVEVEIFQNRSSIITEHKKRYERETRKLVENNNYATENFNLLLEQSSAAMKVYEKDIEEFKKELEGANSLSKMQGILNSAREVYFKFEKSVLEVEENLKLNCKSTSEAMIHKYRETIFAKKEEFSPAEVEWYEEMLAENVQKVETQTKEKDEKAKSVVQFLQKIREERFANFETVYSLALEDLAAKEGSGKKYGRPRRLTQERLRAEMTKCEVAQESLEKEVESLRKLYQDFLSSESEPVPPFSLEIRRKLMKFRACLLKYGNHIEAFKADNKIPNFSRASLNEKKFELNIGTDEEASDAKLQIDELESLGPLFYQKESRTFNGWLIDIETKVKEEASKIYTGNSVKFLTGSDKMPDYLRTYLAKVKANAEDFRINCIRQLREIATQFWKLTQEISSTSLSSVSKYETLHLTQGFSSAKKDFSKTHSDLLNLKSLHMSKLRPNLSNPSNAEELSILVSDEKTRFSKTLETINSTEKLMKVKLFEAAKEFFPRLCSNYEFLMRFSHAAILFEDFVALPGDETIVKKHLSLKTLMYRNQTGIVVDTSSERSLYKEWNTFDRKAFDFEEFKMSASNIQVEAPKDPKTKGKPVASKEKANEETASDKLKTFRTFRQKIIFATAMKSFEDFDSAFKESLCEIHETMARLRDEEEKYAIYWEKSVGDLFIP